MVVVPSTTFVDVAKSVPEVTFVRPLDGTLTGGGTAAVAGHVTATNTTVMCEARLPPVTGPATVVALDPISTVPGVSGTLPGPTHSESKKNGGSSNGNGGNGNIGDLSGDTSEDHEQGGLGIRSKIRPNQVKKTVRLPVGA